MRAEEEGEREESVEKREKSVKRREDCANQINIAVSKVQGRAKLHSLAA